MKSKFATTALFIGALALPIAGFSAEGDKEGAKDFVKDSVITAKIKANMVKDPLVSATAIHVDTDAKGIVQLSGTAKSKAELDKALQIAQSTEGVTKVENKVMVAP